MKILAMVFSAKEALSLVCSVCKILLDQCCIQDFVLKWNNSILDHPSLLVDYMHLEQILQASTLADLPYLAHVY